MAGNETAEEMLSVAAVARRIGVAPATLRTWDRRYGIGPSSHEEGEHRRYCAEDLAKLITMRRLIVAGVSPAQAAEQALKSQGSVELSELRAEIEIREEVAAAILKGLHGFDGVFVADIVRSEIENYGVISAWNEAIVPALVAIGDEWARTGKGIEIEHLFSEILKQTLLQRVVELKKPRNPRPVLVAAIGEELHSLPLYVLGAALCELNIAAHVLGPRTPIEALAAMVTRSAPPAIFLWAQLSENAHVKYFEDIPAIRPAPRILLGGPGWQAIECEPELRVHGLEDACEEVLRAIGA
ncbi:HTH_MlrA-CarA domain containing protein [Candidatus Nanopelagicaceae bacterium]